jgi:hypothetical protein
VIIVHRKFVYPSTYSPGLYTSPSPFIRFLPYLYDIYASSTFWNKKLQLRKKQYALKKIMINMKYFRLSDNSV